MAHTPQRVNRACTYHSRPEKWDGDGLHVGKLFDEVVGVVVLDNGGQQQHCQQRRQALERREQHQLVLEGRDGRHSQTLGQCDVVKVPSHTRNATDGRIVQGHGVVVPANLEHRDKHHEAHDHPGDLPPHGHSQGYIKASQGGLNVPTFVRYTHTNVHCGRWAVKGRTAVQRKMTPRDVLSQRNQHTT